MATRPAALAGETRCSAEHILSSENTFYLQRTHSMASHFAGETRCSGPDCRRPTLTVMEIVPNKSLSLSLSLSLPPPWNARAAPTARTVTARLQRRTGQLHLPAVDFRSLPCVKLYIHACTCIHMHIHTYTRERERERAALRARTRRARERARPPTIRRDGDSLRSESFHPKTFLRCRLPSLSVYTPPQKERRQRT